MMESIKIVIPTAGFGTRMRPHTWSKPKPLVGVAGRTALDYLLDTFRTVPAKNVEYVIIVGPDLGEQHIPPYMQEHYPNLKIHYALQTLMRGQSDAIYMAREHLTGPVITIYSDTLIESDFSFLANEKADGVAWVKSVPDPRHFGVAELDKEGGVARLIEKPQSMENKLAAVGCYYFREGRELASAIEEQMRRGITLRGEFFLVDAINILIERGARIRTQNVDVWLDTGTVEATLETNRYLLEHRRAGKTQNIKRTGVKIVPPAFIHETAEISDSVIGPYASIDANCQITGSRIENSILEAGVTVQSAALSGSFIGRQAKVQGRSANEPLMVLNIGDDSSVILS